MGALAQELRERESFIYSDVITGGEPDVDKAVEVVRILLNAPADSGAPRRTRARSATSRRARPEAASPDPQRRS